MRLSLQTASRRLEALIFLGMFLALLNHCGIQSLLNGAAREIIPPCHSASPTTQEQDSPNSTQSPSAPLCCTHLKMTKEMKAALSDFESQKSFQFVLKSSQQASHSHANLVATRVSKDRSLLRRMTPLYVFEYPPHAPPRMLMLVS